MPNDTPHELTEEVNKRITQACYEYEEGQLGKHMPFIRHLVAQELATAHQQGAAEERERIVQALFSDKKGDYRAWYVGDKLHVVNLNNLVLTERETE